MPAVLAFLLKNWRLFAYAAAVLAVIALGWRIHAWREAYKALPAAQEALQREIDCAAGSTCVERTKALQARSEAASAAVVAGYEQTIRELNEHPVPVRTVRVCVPARPSDVRGAVAASGAHGSPAGPVVPGAAQPDSGTGRDIGPELYQLARDADTVAARLRALQQWNQALAQPQPAQ